MITRADIVSCARTYLGPPATPFQHQGRSKVYGVDCIGLAIRVGLDLGLPVPLYTNYSSQPADDTVLQECRKSLQEISIEEMSYGNILCLRVPCPCHMAIVTDLMGSVGIIHAYAPFEKVVEHNLDFHWRKRIAGVFRFPGVVD